MKKRVEVKQVARLTGHKSSVYTLAATSDPDVFLSAGGDGMVIAWDLKDFSTARLRAQVSGQIFSVLEMPGDRLLVGQMQGGVHVLDVLQKKELRLLQLHEKNVFQISSIGNEKIYSAGGDGEISMLSWPKLELKQQVKISEKSIRSIAFNPQKSEIAAGSSDNNIYIINLENLDVVKVLEQHSNSIFTTCFSPCGKLLLAGGRDAYLSVWNVDENYELYAHIPAHNFTINDIVFNQAGDLFATGSRDKTIKIWDRETLELLKVIDKERLDGHVNSVNKLLWLQNGLLISAGDDRAVMVWQIEENQKKINTST